MKSNLPEIYFLATVCPQYCGGCNVKGGRIRIVNSNHFTTGWNEVANLVEMSPRRNEL